MIILSQMSFFLLQILYIFIFIFIFFFLVRCKIHWIKFFSFLFCSKFIALQMFFLLRFAAAAATFTFIHIHIDLCVWVSEWVRACVWISISISFFIFSLSFFFDLTPKKIFMAVYVVIGFGFGLKDLNLSFFWAGLHPQQKIFFSVINNIRIQNTVCHVYVVFVVVVVSWWLQAQLNN